MFLFVAARGLEEQDGDAAGGDVVAAEVGDEALELFEPAGAALVGVEVYGAAVEDDALLLGELVELLADVVEDGVGGGDEVEVAAEVVGSALARESTAGGGERGPRARRLRGRRADIFFALYVPGIFEHALGVTVDARVS